MSDTSSPDKSPFRRSSPPSPWRLEDIVDQRKLRIQLDAAHLDLLHDPDIARERAKDLLHSALFRGRLIAQERLLQGADGLDTARLLAAVQDTVLSELFHYATTRVFPSPSSVDSEALAVFATGGYGRGVLAPSSDIDILFLRRRKASSWAEQVSEFMLYMLWDIGLKIGHAVRTPDECIKLSRQDTTIKTALMDARFLFGDSKLADEIRQRFHREAIQGRDIEFIADKLAERDNRHARQGGSRFVVEPNVKDGKGGLRDLQTLYWIVKHLQGGASIEDVLDSPFFTDHESLVFMRATRFLWTVRCHLHYLTGRAEERLSFDLQPELAERLGYKDRRDRLGVERFMKRYFIAAKDVGGLSQLLLAKLEAEQLKSKSLNRWIPVGGPKPTAVDGLVVEQGMLNAAEGSDFLDEPLNMLRLFAESQRSNVEIHPAALTAVSRRVKRISEDVRRSPEARSLFFDLLLNGERPADGLKLMNEAGLLGRFVPEFGGIVAQTQFNMYHHYTVDEHTLRAIDAMSAIEHGRSDHSEVFTRAFSDIENRRALYLAMLLHDTGKGHGDQQIEGAKTARTACERLGLDPSETELVAWLVGRHLVMSETAQKRDISDPRTIYRFAGIVGSVERLRLLFILTAADITGVGPNVWNSWKGQLLTELYHATMSALRGGRSNEADLEARLAEQAANRKRELGASNRSVPACMLDMEQAYWTGFDLEELAWHADTLAGSPTVAAACRVSPNGDAVTLLASGPDRVGLFADLAGVAASAGANIASAQIFTSQSGQALDVFVLQNDDGGAFALGEDSRLRRLEIAALDVLNGASPDFTPPKPRDRRGAAFVVQPAVRILSDVSATHTVIDVEARDRPGLLHAVAQTLARHGVAIHSAHVGSYGERVFDAFYVHGPKGEKITDQNVLAAVKAELLTLIAEQEPSAPKTPALELARSPAARSF